MRQSILDDANASENEESVIVKKKYNAPTLTIIKTSLIENRPGAGTDSGAFCPTNGHS